MAVHNRLRVLRAERRWSQSELGRRFARPRDAATVSRWENEDTSPSVEDAFEAAHIFGVSITDVFLYTPETN